jgi:leucyl/phenylalanyl-tRNA--protein transferase
MSRFPDPRYALDDIVAVGDDLRPETLIDAYRHGIFPWPVDDYPLPWFCPMRRAILEFKSVHVSRSLRAAKRKASWRFSIDEDFAGVIAGCAEAPRPGQDGTWIFPNIIEAYVRLHRLGHAHSAEVWEGKELVGGIYGIDGGGVFAGESMFHRRPNASKLVLLHLIEHLQSRGLDWLDVQVMTPHMKALGARTLSRAKFLDRLAATQARGLKLFG